MSTEAETLDQWLRFKMAEVQTTSTNMVLDHVRKQLADSVRPIEFGLGSKIDTLARDTAAMRSHLARVNDLTQSVLLIQGGLKEKVTYEFINERLECLKDYVTVDQFRCLEQDVLKKAKASDLEDQIGLGKALLVRLERDETKI